LSVPNSHLIKVFSIKLKKNKKRTGAREKKQLFCKLKLWLLSWGMQMCCFCAWGVVFPNATIGRKVRGGKKSKPHAEGFAIVEFIFVLYILSLSRLH
jgi:hypothetical protein